MEPRSGEIPALELGVAQGFFAGVMSPPIGMSRRTFSYDDALDTPMYSPPPDFVNVLWKEPVIPDRKSGASAEDSRVALMTPLGLPEAGVAAPPKPLVKTKASSLMSSLMIRHTQETIHKFELQAGLTDTSYTPHKGLPTEETRFLRRSASVPKLKMPSGDFKEAKLSSSAQCTPCGTPTVTPADTPTVTPSVTPVVSPYSSPKTSRRSWFALTPAHFLPPPDLNVGVDMGGNEGGGSGGERWSLFGTRPSVQKSTTDPGSESTVSGFSLQSYFGLQKSSTIEGFKAVVEDPAKHSTVSGVEAQRPLPRAQKLKPRDINALTPSGF